VSVSLLPVSEVLARREALADVYRAAFGAPGYDESEESVARDGGALVGFAYGDDRPAPRRYRQLLVPRVFDDGDLYGLEFRAHP
jgi:hypothetical protein